MAALDAVLAEVDRQCRERTVYMIGPEKAARLAELVRQQKPKTVVECGTALGYSGLCIARELQALGSGKLLTIDIDADRAREAEDHFLSAGMADWIEVRIGDARDLLKQLTGPIDFLFLDCNFENYHPCFLAARDNLADGALVVADNVGVGADDMADYLNLVRSRYASQTEWFDLDLPWHKRDAMEVTQIQRPKPFRGRERGDG
jgi:predicted O-methyltransferase YrrM